MRIARANGQTLRRRVLRKRLGTTLTAGGVAEVMAVHPHDATSKLPRHAMRPPHILGPQPGAEAILGSVRQSHGLVFAPKLRQRDDRTEEFLRKSRILAAATG